MNLLDLKVPVHTRVVWMSPAAKARWEPVVQNMNTAWNLLERLLVVHGHRQACQQPLNLEQYNLLVEWAEQYDLNVGVVRIVKPFQGFSHRYEEASPDDPRAYRVVVVTRDPSLCAAFMSKRLTDAEQGEAFGYPACCRAFFSTVFPRYADPMWQMAMNSPGHWDLRYHTAIDQNPATNSFLRYCGVRLVNYIPCSMQCGPTKEYAKLVTDLMDKEYGTGLATDVLRLLSMNMEWSCNKGIAIVKTPVLQVCTGSVACYPTHTVSVVQPNSELAYPECSVEGAKFPYRTTQPCST